MIYNSQAETMNWAEQRAQDNAPYRDQLKFLFENSAFYRAKLKSAGFSSPDSAGGLDNIEQLPFTEKDELRASRSEQNPIGTHLAVPLDQLTRIFSTSGTTGAPSYIPVTPEDMENWIETCARSYSAAGLKRGDRIVTTYNAGPFVAGATLEAFNRIGLCHIPVGTGNTDRLMSAIRLLKPRAFAGTPSYALHLAEWAAERGIDVSKSSIEQLIVAGEPGGGEPSMRSKLEKAWGARVNEAMGIGDISISIWGECSEQQGMHFSARGFIHFELIDPDTGEQRQMQDGAEGELVLTHLRHRAAPLLRFRSRDHVRIWTSKCACGRTSPRVRCIGRTDDMLIVRGVNVFPSAVREVVSRFAPDVSGMISIRPNALGVKQSPPLNVVVELSETAKPDPALSERIKREIRATLIIATDIKLVPPGTLPRSEYKSKIVDYIDAISTAAPAK